MLPGAMQGHECSNMACDHSLYRLDSDKVRLRSHRHLFPHPLDRSDSAADHLARAKVYIKSARAPAETLANAPRYAHGLRP